jgi:hypothetical protein
LPGNVSEAKLHPFFIDYLDKCNTATISSISSISTRGGGLVPNLLYSPLEEKGASFISSNFTEVT